MNGRGKKRVKWSVYEERNKLGSNCDYLRLLDKTRFRQDEESGSIKSTVERVSSAYKAEFE